MTTEPNSERPQDTSVDGAVGSSDNARRRGAPEDTERARNGNTRAG